MWDCLARVFDLDDPTGRLEWAWAVKKHLRILLKTTSPDGAADAMQTLHAVAKVANLPETDRLLATLQPWWPAIEVLIVTGVTTPAPKPRTPRSRTSNAPATAPATSTATAPAPC